MAHPGGDVPLRDPMAELEHHLMSTYLAGSGRDLHELLQRTDDEARQLLVDASRYASSRLTEVEARSQYLHKLHGDR